MGDRFLWEYDSKNGYLWLSYDLIWSFFEKEFNLNYQEIKEMVKGTMEEHFKCKGVTPTDQSEAYRIEVEEHFKNKQ